jgi:hypothetical protein
MQLRDAMNTYKRTGSRAETEPAPATAIAKPPAASTLVLQIVPVSRCTACCCCGSEVVAYPAIVLVAAPGTVLARHHLAGVL